MSLKIGATIDPANKHDYDVTSLVYIKGKLYSASDDGKIKMWSPDLKLEKEITAHQCSVYSLTTDGDSVLYSCSNEGTVKAWTLDKLEEKGVICTTEKEYWKVFWNEGCLYVLNDQGTIFIFQNGKIVGAIELLEQIKDIAVLDRYIFSVRDLDLVITEQVGEKRRATTRTTLCGRAPLAIAGDKLAYSSRDGRSVLVNYNHKDKQFKTMAEIKDVHDKLINAITAKEVNGTIHVYSGGWDCILKEWLISEDSHKPGAMCTVPTYINVICVDSESNKIFVAGGEGNIWRIDSN